MCTIKKSIIHFFSWICPVISILFINLNSLLFLVSQRFTSWIFYKKALAYKQTVIYVWCVSDCFSKFKNSLICQIRFLTCFGFLSNYQSFFKEKIADYQVALRNWNTEILFNFESVVWQEYLDLKSVQDVSWKHLLLI